MGNGHQKRGTSQATTKKSSNQTINNNINIINNITQITYHNGTTGSSMNGNLQVNPRSLTNTSKEF